MFDHQPRHKFSTDSDYDKAWASVDKKNRWFKNTLGIIMLACVLYWVWLLIMFVRVHGWA